MAEWTNAPVLKTGDPQGSVGSNPTPSANLRLRPPASWLRLAAPLGLGADWLRRWDGVRDGGFILSCDHGIPSDVSWKNFVDYCRQLAEMTGWL